LRAFLGGGEELIHSVCQEGLSCGIGYCFSFRLARFTSTKIV